MKYIYTTFRAFTSKVATLNRKSIFLLAVLTMAITLVAVKVTDHMSNVSSMYDGTGVEYTPGSPPKPKVWRQIGNQTKVKPTFIIIGHRKCGTGALREIISLHNSITPPLYREINYFCHNKNFELGEEWYMDHFPFLEEGQITFEKTPNYVASEKAPERMYEFDPDVNLVIAVRDPVVRLVSDLVEKSMGRKNLIDGKPAIPLDHLFDNVKIEPRTPEISEGLYALHLSRWLKYFSQKQVFIVNGEILIERPWEEMTRLETFLNLPHELDEERFVFNSTKGFYCIKRSREDADEGICLGDSKGRAHPEMPESLEEDLRDFFGPWNKEFEDMTGMKFYWP